MRKRTQTLISGLDILFNSLTTFIAFVYINLNLGYDITGYYGLVLSVSAFAETIQMGLYEKPAYLGYKNGLNGKSLNFYHLIIVCIMPLLFIDRFILSGFLIMSLIFCLSYLGIQNIRVFDYVNKNIKTSFTRSLIIFLIVIFALAYLIFQSLEINLNQVFAIIALPRALFIFVNRKKLFSIKNDKDADNLSMLISSTLTMVRSRLPLWALLPFGLGLVGIYESFRNILEIYLTPSRPVFIIMMNNLKTEGPKKLLQFGVVFCFLTVLFVATSFFFLTNTALFDIDEINNFSTFIIMLIIVTCFWLSETTGMVFEFNSYFSFEAIRRFSSILIYGILSLLLIEYLNFQYFLFLIAFMYFTEALISFVYRKRLI